MFGLIKMKWQQSIALMLTLAVMMPDIVHANDEPELLDRVLVIVDDDIVMESELKQRLRQITQRLLAQGTRLPPQEIMNQRVLEQLILESIQLQKADLAGIRVSDAQLNETLVNIASSSGMTLQQFQQQLAKEGETYAAAREQIRREMLVSRVQQREVDRRVRVTEQEINNFLSSSEARERSGTEYYIGHILISVPEDATAEQEEAAQERADAVLAELKNGADFQQVAIARSDGRQALNGGVIGWRKENELPSIAADVLPNLEKGQPSELIRSASGFHIITALDKRGGTEQWVEQRKVRHILVAPSAIRSDRQAKEIIDKLYERVINGDDFAELARSNSDDPVSAIDGGALDWVSPGQMVPEFEDVMNATKVGEISEPFRSNFGWHILQVQDSRQQDISALVQENQARQLIYRRKFEEELVIWLQEIKSEAFIEFKDETLRVEGL
ncbi:MAG: peptidylprolyl isomerase [Oleiphilaceae bacterium]|nr:peptidylprolyl isomerase [Oleiphilaceae bacterium]